MNRILLNTKRTWLMLVVLLGVSLQNAFAQVSAYTFAASTGTYTPITGGTPMVLLPAATGPFGSFTIFNNDVNGANTTNTGFPIGFTFKYNNTDFTNFAISANGFIRLGTGTFASSSTTLPISSTLTTTPNIIAPMAVTTNVGVRATGATTTGLADVVVVSAAGIEVGTRAFGTGVPAGATVTAIVGTTITLSASMTATSAAVVLSFAGEISYQTTGVSPNRRLTVQWKNCARNTTAPAELINHQLILEETTNNVVFRYGDIGITVATTAQVGLKGFNETDFNNRTTLTDWSATTAGATAVASATLNPTVRPTTGQVFTFSPNLTACVAPGGMNVTNLNSTSVTLNWVSTPLATAYNVEYRLTSTAPAGAFTVATGSPFAGTTASITGLNLSTAYQWRVQSVCAGPTTSTFLPAFYQGVFTTLSACVAPTALVASSITTTGATLSWVGNLTATNYNLEYRQVGTIPYVTVVVASTTSTLTGLLVGTSYEWRVTSNCAGAVPTAVSTQVVFTTVCTVSSLPFNESFEGITTTNQIPSCMAVSSTTICLTNIATVTFGNRIPRTGTKSASFRYGTAATGDYFYTVPLQMTAGTNYQFSTWYTTDGNANWGTLDAWVGPNQSPTGLVAIPGASVTGPSLLTYSELAGTFTVPTTGIYYVALRCVTPSFSPNYLTFDDMFVGLPPACIVPSGITASTLGNTTATVSWNAVVGSTGYNVQYRIVGAPTFTPFPGNPVTVGTSANLTGLNASTNYEVQVQNICSPTLSSAYSFSSSFATACSPVTALPYQEDFESITVNDQLPNCMARSSTSICKTYIAAQTTYNRIPRSGTKFASFQYGTAATGDYFYTAPIQMTAGTTYQFSTWYIVDATGGWTALDAWVGPNQNPTGLVAIPGASVTSPNSQTYQELASTFTVPTTGVYYVALRAIGTGFTPWYLSFDDMFVGLPPACIVPNGITASTLGNTTATVSWNAVAGSTGYNVQYRPIGAPSFTAFPGNPVTVGTSVNLTGLSASTNYEIQIQNICSTILTSTYSFSGSFATTCAPVNVFPYFEGFEGIAVNNELPNCMTRTDPTLCLTYAIAPAGSNRIPRTGSKFASFRWNSVVGGNYFYSAPLALIAGKTYDFSTWYITDGANGWTTLDAWVGPNQNPTGLVAIAGATVSGPTNTIYAQLAGSFVPTTTGTYYVALRCVATVPPNFLSFDDMSVVSPCVGAVFTTLTLPAGTTSAAYNETITATGGVAPYTFTVTNGTLPAGLTLDPTTGVISGTPTTVNITPPNFTVTISDATSCTTNKNYSIVITGVPCVAISITPTTVPAATLGVLYPATAVQFVGSGVAGATYAYNIVSGVLPSGMTLSSSTGRLTGTPNSRPASPTITVRARITTGPSAGCFGIVTLDLVVNCPVMTFAPATISDAVVNLQYSQQFTATYGTTTPPTTTGFTFTTTSTLPLGFTLSTAGVLSGTSATLSTPTSITIKATRSNGCNVSQTYTFGVVPTIAAPTVLKPIQISSSSFRARWTPVQRATKYRLYIATSPTFDGGTFAIGYVGLAVVGDTSILVQNLKPETKYYIQVTAISSADEVSPYSNIENGTTLSAVTGIDNALSSQVKVSPNPSNDKFSVDFGTLNLGKTTARVYDAQGKQVLSSEINGNQTTISLGNMANGIYLLEISSNKGRILKRLVKE